MSDFSVAIFAHDTVGVGCLRWLLENHRECVGCVVVTGSDSEAHRVAVDQGVPLERILLAESLYEPESLSVLRALDASFFVLAWWPLIVKEPVLEIPRVGVLNFHPSLLPHNRGKHPNFWSIVEERPFGVTIHFATTRIDAGDILFQKEIPVTWADTGGSLHRQGQQAMIELFSASFPRLVAGDFERRPQRTEEGSFHRGKELEPASRIELDETVTARNLLNRLRARTFEPWPACWFVDDDGVEWEARVSITARKRA